MTFSGQILNAQRAAHDDQNWSHLRFNINSRLHLDIVRAANNHIAQTEPWKLGSLILNNLKVFCSGSGTFYVSARSIYILSCLILQRKCGPDSFEITN